MQFCQGLSCVASSARPEQYLNRHSHRGTIGTKNQISNMGKRDSAVPPCFDIVGDEPVGQDVSNANSGNANDSASGTARR